MPICEVLTHCISINHHGQIIFQVQPYQYDPNAIQLHEVLVDAAGVCLKETGDQPDHIQPGVPHRRVQHTPRGLHHAFLRKKQLSD